MRAAVMVVTPALALGGVLAVCAAAAVRSDRHPSVAAGALAGVAVFLGARWQAQGIALAVGAAALVTGVAAAAAGVLAGANGPFARTAGRDLGVGLPPVMSDTAALGLLLAVAAVARPATALDLGAGPLGGTPLTLPALAAGVVGLVGAIVLQSTVVLQLPDVMRWAAAGVLVALSAVPASGLLNQPEAAAALTVGAADAAGLAVRAVAVALVAGRSVTALVGTGLVLGAAEVLAAAADPRLALIPAALVLVAGVALYLRRRRD